MQLLRLVCAVALPGLVACGVLYDDTGTADPGSPWPWVCADGGVAPESGCLAEVPSPDGQAADANAPDSAPPP